MALYKDHYIELDTKISPRISLRNIVSGETGNRLWITVKNNGETIDMSEKSNGEFIYRVCLRVDSDLGTRRQDSSMQNSGITFIEENTGNHGKINILLSKDSYAAGINRCSLEIFSSRAAANDTLICSSEFNFISAKNPTGENAGSVYPSLIQAEHDAEEATSAANTAATAANSAASAASTAAASATSAAASANAAAAASGIFFIETESWEANVQAGCYQTHAKYPDATREAYTEGKKRFMFVFPVTWGGNPHQITMYETYRIDSAYQVYLQGRSIGSSPDHDAIVKMMDSNVLIEFYL